MRSLVRDWKTWVLLACAAVLFAVPSAHIYYTASWGRGCASCHEMRDNFDQWHASTHRGVNCTSCHEASLSTSLRHVSVHLFGEVPERIHARPEDVDALVGRCKSCHQQEFARWQSGAHSATYTRIFANADHNKKRLLMDDCLRCHGMHFAGSISDLVQPVDTHGPWKVVEGRANAPAIPCLGCHTLHREGPVLVKADRQPGGNQPVAPPSLGLYDRRTQMNVKLGLLPLPALFEGTRPVRVAPDQRSALCYQCHAPRPDMQVASGDDRTPVGVHEGISCLACHEKHGQQTRASCSSCHPRFSNCKLDVEKMDTTFVSKNSRHNIHWVKCADCHPKGIPKSMTAPQVAKARVASTGD